jgi:hypothetical protein
VTDFDPDAHLDSTDADSSFDPDAHLDSVSTPTVSEQPKSKKDQLVAEMNRGPSGPLGDIIHQGASSIGHTIVGGYKGLGQIVAGNGPDAGAQAVTDEQAKTYQPSAQNQKTIDFAKNAATALSGNALLAQAQPAADYAADKSADLGAPPLLSAAIKSGPAALPLVLGASGLARKGLATGSSTIEVAPEAAAAAAPRLSAQNLSLEQTPGRTLPQAVPQQAAPSTPLTASAIPRTPSWEAQDPKAPPAYVDSEPVRGGLVQSDDARGHRAKILADVGIQSARESALGGDRGNAATDFQMTKFNQEPAGQAAAAQFEHEKTALTNHAEGIVNDTGGTVGTDQDSLYNRGKVIDAPFKALRDWFKEQSKSDYATVKEKFGENPIGKMDQTDVLLKDPDFTETLLAKDQGGLLGSVQRQFQRFHDLNPNGFTVDTAENFRKFVNSVWTKQNSAALGKITNAVDADVTQAAGSDVHASARARVQLKHQLLDDPHGVSDLFDFDPKTPKNRSTAFNEIPKELTRLDPDQLKGVLDTLDQMPAELQDKAQAAKAEIKAQYANQLLEEGAKTQGQWNSPGVSKFIKGNSANLKAVFGDDPTALKKIQDLDSAGRIIKVDQSYPGAAAQAANAVKRGMMSHIITKASTSAGAMAGGAIGSLAGPAGAAGGGAVGAAAGEALGSRASQSIAEGRALKGWQRRVTSLADMQSKPTK